MRPTDIDLDWELGVFKALRALWRGMSRAPAPRFDEERVAWLCDHQSRLIPLASMLANQPITVDIARGHGGIRGTQLLLPEAIDIAPDPESNRLLYVMRVCMDATIVRLRPTTVGPDATLDVAARARACLSEELPRFAGALEALLPYFGVPDPETGACLLWGRLLEVQGADDVSGDGQPLNDAVQTERKAPGIEDITLSTLDEEDVKDLPAHAFEKVELLEEFNGNIRQLDGDDDLEAHLEALEEVQLGHLIRGGPQSASLLKADVGIETEIPDVSKVAGDEPFVSYPEWDHRSGSYRPDWCAVYPTALPMRASTGLADQRIAHHHALIDRLHSRLLEHRTRRSNLSRQTDGDLDLDAVVAAHADLRAGRTPSDRLYHRRPRTQRDIATTVLLDISLSSDAWINNVRVLDVARDAILVLGEVAERLHDNVQVLAFASHTRNRIRVFNVWDWREPWRHGKVRLEQLKPQGYTRIGPAIRHATAGLAAQGARQKLLLVITDGKPTDFDRYEGRYGVHDVQRAIREAHVLGIGVHALAIDSVTHPALPTMFGAGRWTLLPDPNELPEALALAYGRLAT